MSKENLNPKSNVLETDKSSSENEDKKIEGTLIKIYGSHHEARRQLWKALEKEGISPDTICPIENKRYSTFGLDKLSKLLETATKQEEAA